MQTSGEGGGAPGPPPPKAEFVTVGGGRRLVKGGVGRWGEWVAGCCPQAAERSFKMAVQGSESSPTTTQPAPSPITSQETVERVDFAVATELLLGLAWGQTADFFF